MDIHKNYEIYKGKERGGICSISGYSLPCKSIASFKAFRMLVAEIELDGPNFVIENRPVMGGTIHFTWRLWEHKFCFDFSLPHIP